MMKHVISLILIVFLSASPAFAIDLAKEIEQLTVEFAEPETGYRDFRANRWNSARSRAGLEQEWVKYLKKLTARILPEEIRLALRFEEIDLAGEYEPWRSRFGEVRIIRGVYPPYLQFHYRLYDHCNNVIQQDSIRLQDLGFLQRVGRWRSHDRLRFEKALLSRWFRRTFSELPVPTACYITQ